MKALCRAMAFQLPCTRSVTECWSRKARISFSGWKCRVTPCRAHSFSSASVAEKGAAEKAAAGPASDEEEWKGGAVSMVSGLSQYLLKGCTPWREAPPCPDYVGSVEVARTTDGRGRGLFATQDIGIGTVLLISNPMAISYDDPQRIGLLSKLVRHAQRDPLFLRKLYSLAHTQSSQHRLEVPSMEFLTSDCLDYAASEEFIDPEPVDPARIMDIIMLNSFEGEYKDGKQDPQTWFCSLYLIPSLINHSCHRNASRLIIGGAMIIHATADIQKGEEITITYVSTVAPLQRRRKSSSSMKFGFMCKCQRCIVEESVQDSLYDLSELYCNLHDKARNEVYAIMYAPENSNPAAPLSTVTKLYNVFNDVHERVHANNGLSEREKRWVLAGYSSAYLGRWLVSGYSSGFSDLAVLLDERVVEVIRALRTTVPGLVHTLSLATSVVGLTQRLKSKLELGKEVFILGMAECSGVYGNQKSEIMLKLMEKSREVIPFF